MMQPSNRDIEAAKGYMRRRLEAERSMVYNSELLMREAAERIANILYAAKIDPTRLSYEKLPDKIKEKIDNVIDWLKSAIEDYFLTLALYEKDDHKTILLPLIMGENHGLTFSDRLSDYCKKYRTELFVLIGAGLSLKLSKKAVVNSIGQNLKRPYSNPKLSDGITTPIPSYGRGKVNSMFTAISNLATYGISQAWMKDKYLEDKEDGAIGWMVERGSTYPCDFCDAMVGFHSNESELPPYHGHCCCIAIPVYRKSKSIL